MSIPVAPLPRSTPEAEGVRTRGILDFLAAIKAARLELHSFMLLRHGKVVAEAWWHPYTAEMNHMLYSLSKSFTSTAIGLAVAEGRMTVDDAVADYFPEEVSAHAADNPFVKQMTVKHLLSMNTGHGLEPTWHMLSNAKTWAEGFFEVPVMTEPGTHFLYNTGATYMLAAILHKITGESLVEYLTPRLFAPLGIQNPEWQMSPQGINTGGFGLSITTEDIAKFGQLYLQKGVWEGKQLVPEAWVEEATRLTSENGYPSVGSDWAQGYGYQFWRCQPAGAYRGDGAFGQFCVVLPEQDAVLVMTSAVAEMQPQLDLAWAHLLPAMAATPLDEDAALQAELAAAIAGFAIAPMPGEATAPVAESVLGVWYKLNENDFQIARVRITDEGGWTTLQLETPRGIESTPIGYGEWLEGRTEIYSGPPRFPSTRAFSSGAWQTPDTWRATIRMVETPMFATVGLAFLGDKVIFSNRLNLNMGPTVFPDLVGTRE